MGLRRWIAGLLGREKAAPRPVPQAEERDYSLDELASYDGSDPDLPILIAVKGEVYDMTRGRDFYGPGGPYAMFAGKDCTRALAKMSFDLEDFTGNTAGLDQDELDKLEDWIEMFDAKYRRLGKLR